MIFLCPDSALRFKVFASLLYMRSLSALYAFPVPALGRAVRHGTPLVCAGVRNIQLAA
jgi:hypothetical protein